MGATVYRAKSRAGRSIFPRSRRQLEEVRILRYMFTRKSEIRGIAAAKRRQKEMMEYGALPDPVCTAVLATKSRPVWGRFLPVHGYWICVRSSLDDWGNWGNNIESLLVLKPGAEEFIEFKKLDRHGRRQVLDLIRWGEKDTIGGPTVVAPKYALHDGPPGYGN
ncbi:MAG: hypothetical protein A3H73_02855 [Candidatus Taylorbacteria bacterium RIFCSPLOWO2_02_FULL_50_120]|nr:MAG: hypothetical protein A3H73_02855 [Candidatus Taylorbacteria bacterium RIFCSPLOWO2_02_FULL_50_120]